ncbi:MAG TPA: iron-containing redox enzyme family protein [Candidatus Saccharimonadales bacterium]|nr:iron-containing redox enzyme family protein [Candidatus Saccharimonadales bacterium]
MNLYQSLREKVLRHGAINNPYLDRFQRGEIAEADLRDFAIQFYGFVKHFPRILATLLANTPDPRAADELCVILASELGDGKPERRHEYLYHRFLESIDIDPRTALSGGMEPETEDFVRGMAELYGHRDYGVALGASFGLENMAITMWDHLLPGLRKLKDRPERAKMDIGYFTFHRELESQHEDGMESALAGSTELEVDSLKYGIETMLNYLQRMWMGLEKRWHLRRGEKRIGLRQTWARPKDVV